MQENIYYCYEKANGKFAGSGIFPVEDENYSSTTVPLIPSIPVDYGDYDYLPHWNGEHWIIPENPNLITTVSSLSGVSNVDNAEILDTNNSENLDQSNIIP